MPITPIGGMVYANQNMQVPATQQADFQQRLDAQANAAMVASNEEKKEIEEIRPTEETLEIDPEKEHEKHKNDGETDGEEEKEPEVEEEIELQNKREEILKDEEKHVLDVVI